MSEFELDLESRIIAAYQETLDAECATVRRVKWRKFQALVLQRSPERRRQMEAEKGLADDVRRLQGECEIT